MEHKSKFSFSKCGVISILSAASFERLTKEEDRNIERESERVSGRREEVFEQTESCSVAKSGQSESWLKQDNIFAVSLSTSFSCDQMASFAFASRNAAPLTFSPVPELRGFEKLDLSIDARLSCAVVSFFHLLFFAL